LTACAGRKIGHGLSGKIPSNIVKRKNLTAPLDQVEFFSPCKSANLGAIFFPERISLFFLLRDVI
jgi:hypothetical protein